MQAFLATSLMYIGNSKDLKITLYLLEDCGHKEATVDLEPANPYMNARHRKLKIVGLAIVICGSKVVRTK